MNILETTERLNKRPKLTKPVEWTKFKQPSGKVNTPKEASQLGKREGWFKSIAR